MKISYTENQERKAVDGVIAIYKIAEERIRRSCIPCSLVQLRNAFQVFRYAFREWALGRGEGEVLRALMYADSRAREVKSGITEMVIRCDDPEMARALEELLRRDGYEAEGH